MTDLMSIQDFTEASDGFQLVFLYDDLLDDQRLCDLCPGASFLMIARLPGYRLLVNRQGVVAAAPSQNSTIYGIVVEIPDVEIPELEARFATEGLDERSTEFADGCLGEGFLVEVWTSSDDREGWAEPIRIVQLLALAHEFRFPDSYLAEIANWAKGTDDVLTGTLRRVS